MQLGLQRSLVLQVTQSPIGTLPFGHFQPPDLSSQVDSNMSIGTSSLVKLQRFDCFGKGPNRAPVKSSELRYGQPPSQC